MNKTLLAIVGLPGSGKTEATEYILKKTGWPKVYFGDVTFAEMKKRGLSVSEENERTVREEIRKEYGMGAYALLSLPKIKELFASSSVVLESLYSWEEYLAIKNEFGDEFKVLAIYASPAARCARMKKRKIRPLTDAEFLSRDYSQIENLHQAGPIARADVTVINEGNLDDLHRNLNEVLKKF